MKELPILSIVIPVYNVEKYLKENLNSIFNQKYHNCIEVIIVDDCSPDNSLSIASEFSKKYPNLKILRHEKNKGLGAARNTGLMNSKGKYVWFIDSDDVIINGSIQKILNEISLNDEDILMFNSEVLNKDGSRSSYYATFPSTTPLITGNQYLNLREVPHWKKPVTAWSRIQKVSFLNEHKFRYPEGIFFEDEELNLRELFEAKKVRFLKDVFYLYRNNEESIMKTRFTVKKFIDKVKVFISCLNILYEYRKIYPDTVSIIYQTHLSVLKQMNKIYAQMPKDERARIRLLIKEIDTAPIKHFSKSYWPFMLYFSPNMYEKLRRFLWVK